MEEIFSKKTNAEDKRFRIRRSHKNALLNARLDDKMIGYFLNARNEQLLVTF